MIYQCFQSLRLYGKEPETLDGTVAMFQLVLADYRPDDIRAAFAIYLRRSNEMPAPADIASIIDCGLKPPPDKTVYVALSRKPAEDRTPDEWAYMRGYERFAMRAG